ncbi:hypothetical protein BOX15_Mlig024206g1 [Macrostomum lignano]|uniref:Uncharacterized protein n=1 Tax=Macrostomum lignano TaxID=282301 RepID=A0A267FEY7_9PLAT|nr:hypothetical protein BOX15_Mlig024206g1 [Macrostomum lignano]
MLCCCFRNGKWRPRRGNGTAAAVNAEYMQSWAGHQQTHNLRGADSDENLYIDPDEVPESIRMHAKLPPPPQQPQQPNANPDEEGELYGDDPQTGLYAVLDIESLSKPAGPPPLQQQRLHQSVAPPSSAPRPRSQLLTRNGAYQASAAASASTGNLTLASAAADEEERLNPIYSDIVGVLKQ